MGFYLNKIKMGLQINLYRKMKVVFLVVFVTFVFASQTTADKPPLPCSDKQVGAAVRKCIRKEGNCKVGCVRCVNNNCGGDMPGRMFAGCVVKQCSKQCMCKKVCLKNCLTL